MPARCAAVVAGVPLPVIPAPTETELTLTRSGTGTDCGPSGDPTRHSRRSPPRSRYTSHCPSGENSAERGEPSGP